MKINVALDLHKFYQRIINEPNPEFGVTLYAFHTPGKSYHFKRPSEIKELANKIGKSMLKARQK
jgi:hypothetical protein